jgi:DNA-binding NtrC family response regulator
MRDDAHVGSTHRIWRFGMGQGQAPDIPYGPGPLKGLRVLVVEDDAATAYSVELILMENGARVVATCAGVEEAQRRIENDEIDFALIDLKLADQFADDLINDTISRNLRFAVMTGLVAYPSNVHEHSVGVLRKPFNSRQLVGMLAKFA